MYESFTILDTLVLPPLGVQNSCLPVMDLSKSFIELSDTELDNTSDYLTETQLLSILSSKLWKTLIQQNSHLIKSSLIKHRLSNAS